MRTFLFCILVILWSYFALNRLEQYRARCYSVWKVTAYCSCKLCTGNNKGITASGKKVRTDYVANNWLPFGTKIEIKKLGIYTVEDRGSERYFGNKYNKLKCIDIYMNSHKQAKDFGIRYLLVRVIK